VLHTLYYDHELHKASKPAAPKTKFSSQELELARSLVSHMAAPFKPGAFHDAYRENVERLIEQKTKGQKITAVAKPSKAPVIDLMEALKRSLKSTATSESSSQGRRRASKSSSRRRRAA